MPRTTPGIFRWIGWKLQGDLGPWTLYTSRRGHPVAYPQSPPLDPPSQLQLQQRAKFRRAANAWRAASRETRDAWERASKAASLGCTGYNLFVLTFARADGALMRTIAAQTRIALSAPPGVK
jgi:hypothetical protein